VPQTQGLDEIDAAVAAERLSPRQSTASR
jgi:hypothetical protein